MRHLVPHFSFTLARNESIGPAQLCELWQRAACSTQISVDRRFVRGDRERPVYMLYALPGLPDLPGAERRLRSLFEAASINASLMPVHE